LVLAAIGCGGPQPPSVIKPDVARAALVHALDAWRNGEAADVLKRRSPPIHVAEDSWRMGEKLVDYKLQGDGETVGHQWSCKVVLSLLDKPGKPRRLTTSYLVTTGRTLSVVRQEN
jgi:hypothetical protein